MVPFTEFFSTKVPVTMSQVDSSDCSVSRNIGMHKQTLFSDVDLLILAEVQSSSQKINENSILSSFSELILTL